MAQVIAFDTLAYAKKLKAVGFTEEQAEVQAEVLAEIVNEHLATKEDISLLRRDLKELEVTLKRDMKELEVTLKRDMKELEVTLKRDMKELEMRLTIRLGAMLTVAIAVIATLVKLL